MELRAMYVVFILFCTLNLIMPRLKLNIYISKRSFYQILDVQPSSEPKQIKDNFYKLSKEFHPDINKVNLISFLFFNHFFFTPCSFEIRDIKYLLILGYYPSPPGRALITFLDLLLFY